MKNQSSSRSRKSCSHTAAEKQLKARIYDLKKELEETRKQKELLEEANEEMNRDFSMAARTIEDLRKEVEQYNRIIREIKVRFSQEVWKANSMKDISVELIKKINSFAYEPDYVFENNFWSEELEDDDLPF